MTNPSSNAPRITIEGYSYLPLSIPFRSFIKIFRKSNTADHLWLSNVNLQYSNVQYFNVYNWQKAESMELDGKSDQARLDLDHASLRF